MSDLIHKAVAEQIMKGRVRPVIELQRELSKKFSFNDMDTNTTGVRHAFDAVFQYTKGYYMSYPTIEVGRMDPDLVFRTLCYASTHQMTEVEMQKWLSTDKAVSSSL